MATLPLLAHLPSNGDRAFSTLDTGNSPAHIAETKNPGGLQPPGLLNARGLPVTLSRPSLD